MSEITYRRLLKGDEIVLANVAEGVFDHDIIPARSEAYLAEPRYEMIVALEDERVVGMVSGFSYFHPDKADEFYVNECGVGDAYLRRGIATKMMEIIFQHAKSLGCEYCWLGTELDNLEANALYKKLGGKVSKMNFFEFELH